MASVANARWVACDASQLIALPQEAVFESLRGVVLQDWTDATASEQRTAAVRALTKKYRVIFQSQSQ